MKNKFGSRIVDTTIVVIIALSILICFVPFLYIISMSLSSNEAILSQKVSLYPVGFTLETYKAILMDRSMIFTLFYTIALTIGYTAVCMFLTICAAYPMTKKRLKGRSLILLLLTITMYFSGGIIPEYVLVKSLNLLDTVWSLILPGALSVYNMIILKTFFTSLPESLDESASIEGANDLVILIKIILPLSMPAIATLSLFYAVGRWNGFQDALIYITDRNLFPMQLKLYQIITVNQGLDMAQGEGSVGITIQPEALKAASIIFATVPILIVYPWLQRYFVSGVMIGSIKG